MTQQLNQNLDKLGSWIIQNEDLKGTEDFQVVADEYKRLREIYDSGAAEEIDSIAKEEENPQLVPWDGTAAPDSKYMTDEEIQQMFDQSFTPEAQQRAIREGTGPIGDFTRSLGTGVLKFGTGVTQLALEGAEAIGVPGAGQARQEFTDQWQNYFDQEEAKGEDNPLASTIGDVGGQIGVLFFSPIKTQNNLIPKLAKNVSEFAALESILFKEDGESRLEDAKDAAGMSAIVTTLFHGGGKIVDAATRSNAAKKISDELARASKELKIPLTVGQLKNSSTFMTVENILSHVPIFGTKGFGNRQYLAFEEAADRMVKQIGGEVDDVGLALSASLKKTFERNKNIVKKKYNNVQRLMGDRQLPTTNLNLASQKISKDLRQNAEILGTNPAQKITDRATAGTTPQKIMSPIVDRLGNQIQKGVDKKTKTYAELRGLRTEYGRQVSQALKGLREGKTTFSEVKALLSLQKAVEADLKAATTAAGGNIQKVADSANTAYINLVAPFKKGKLRDSIADGVDTDMILQKFLNRDKIFGTGQRKIKQLFANTDKGGQKAVKHSLLKDAWNEASKNGAFDPQKFASILQKTGSSRKVIFSATEKAEIDGFVKLANAVPGFTRSELTNPNFAARRVAGIGGRELTQLATAGGAAAASTAAPTMAIPILGGMAGVSFLLTSEAGRAIVRAANKVTDEKGMTALIIRANKELTKIASQLTKGVAVIDEE